MNSLQISMLSQISGTNTPNIMNEKVMDLSNNDLALLNRVDNYEIELMKVQEKNNENQKLIKDLKEENSNFSSDLSKKDGELKSLTYQIEDFKKRANVGQLDYYEQQIKKKDEKILELNNLLIQQKQEFDFKSREWLDKIESHRKQELKLKKNEDQLTKINTQSLDYFNTSKEITEASKAKLIELDNDLEFERQKFKNLQEMAIIDKERCVEFELKITRHEMELNSKNLVIHEMTLKGSTLSERIEELESKLEEKELKESAYTNETKLDNFEIELSTHFNNNFKQKNVEVNKQTEVLSKMIKIEENIKSMKIGMVKNERDLNTRNENLKREMDKLREELARSRIKNNDLREKLEKTETELLKKTDFSLNKDENEDFENFNQNSRNESSSSAIAQNLLRKLLKCEKELEDLRYDKEKRSEEELKRNEKHMEDVCLIYSIMSDNYLIHSN